MHTRTSSQKADAFHALHYTGKLLKLPNVWNPIGARVLAAKGYPAIATASAAISANLGYVDGERIKRATLIDQLSRIAKSVETPVSADIEAGYAETSDELAETIRLVLESGIVGINLEDSIDDTHTLRPIDEQCERISIARATANLAGINLFINARIDTFFCPDYPDADAAITAFEQRANAYLRAGASGLYPIGPSDLETAKRLRDLTEAPLNLLASPQTRARPSELEAIGINRLSFGPFVFRSCLRKFESIAQSLLEEDNCNAISDAIPGPEVARYLNDATED